MYAKKSYKKNKFINFVGKQKKNRKKQCKIFKQLKK